MSDSHTNFNAGGFSAGAFGGATLLASGLAAGIENARARSWDRFNRRALIAAVELTEARHNMVFRQLQGATRRVDALESEIIALRAELKAGRARQLLVQLG